MRFLGFSRLLQDEFLKNELPPEGEHLSGMAIFKAQNEAVWLAEIASKKFDLKLLEIFEEESGGSFLFESVSWISLKFTNGHKTKCCSPVTESVWRPRITGI